MTDFPVSTAFRRIRIGIRMMVFLGLPIISLILFGFFALSDLQKIGDYALESGTYLGNNAITDSTKALEELGEKIIAQKAADVALQCRIYLNTQTGITIGQLRRNKDFRKIAVQSVGNTGYTILYDKNGIMRFHPNAELIDFDMHKWKDKLPIFWGIFEKTFSGLPASGYYDWQDADRKIRRKFMSIVPIKGTPYMIAATTYIDEFSIPMNQTREKIAFATQTINDNITEKFQNIYISFVLFLIILILVVMSISYLLSKSITGPIMALIEGAKAIGQGRIDHCVQLHTEDEFEDLANAFNRMTSDLKSQMVKLERTTADKEGLLKELEIARNIQQRLIPSQPPEIAGVEIAANNIPAREVGGDFYDFIPVARDHWGVVIADVSGKGMPAAMFMGLSRTVVRASTTGNISPSSAIMQANEIICRDSTSGMFVTLFYAMIDSSREIRYVNAGHNPPLLFRTSLDNPIPLKTKGIALGVKQNIELQELREKLEPGDLLVLYTDGVTEAINDRGEAYGVERLLDVVQKCRFEKAGVVLDAIQKDVIAFAEHQPQYDDITMVIVKIL